MPKPTQTVPPTKPTDESVAELDTEMIGTSAHHQRSENIIDKMFGRESDDDDDTDEDDSAEEETVEVIDPDTEEESEEEESEEESEEPEEEEEEESEGDEDDSEVDWDEPDAGKKDKEEDKDAPLDESAAQREARIRGREAKELKVKLQERELELERLREERDLLSARAQELEAVNIRPEEHPDYRMLHTEIMSDVHEGADLLSIPSPKVVTDNFGQLMAGYLKMSALTGAEREAAREELRGSMVDLISGSDVPYSDMDESERSEYNSSVNDILKIVQRNSSKVRELQKVYDQISAKAKTGKLATGVREYEMAVKEIKPVLDSVGELSEDMIEADPFSADAVVAKLIKESPEQRKLLERAKSDVLEVILGPRALTQDDIDKLEAKGEDVREFLAQRNKAHRSKQTKFAAMFVQALMTRKQLKQVMAENAELRANSDAEESEQDALRGSHKKKAPKPQAPVQKKKSPLQMLGIDDSDD